MTRHRNELKIIGFDADDTLWQNERFFRGTQQRFEALLADYVQGAHLHERLLAAERRNLGHYGYGIKGFTLSMIETAIEVSDARVPAAVLAEILEAGRQMLSHPVELLPGVRSTVERLAREYRIVLITKGDLLDQERKLAASGLGEVFDAVEIVSEKTPAVYHRIFRSQGHEPEAAMMVGNSMRSDVIPALETGAWGVHVPHGLTWELEHANAPADHPRFQHLDRIEALPDLILSL
ncbi:HAD family hydrolase [Brevirhabdus sp.]|uniref:HAD family hydrolase n=1 Tax=Brevirhabdus sp. TaxID=2004514 RepID=UPI00405860E8